MVIFMDLTILLKSYPALHLDEDSSASPRTTTLGLYIYFNAVYYLGWILSTGDGIEDAFNIGITMLVTYSHFIQAFFMDYLCLICNTTAFGCFLQ